MTKMEPISSLFPRLRGLGNNNAEFRQALVFAAWKRTVGDRIGGNTAPILLNGSCLQVAVRDRTWQRELKGLAAELLETLGRTAAGGFVNRLEFRIDDSKVEAGGSETHDRGHSFDTPAASVLESVDLEIEKAADRITDTDLKEQFLLAAGSVAVRNERYGRT